MRVFILLLLLASFTYSAKSNSEYLFVRNIDFRNVKIKIEGTNLPMMNKYGIIGNLTKNLCEKYSYYDSVLVDFCLNNNRQADSVNLYLISYDIGCWNVLNEETETKQETATDYMNDLICIYSNLAEFNPENILKLVEYSILNRNHFSDFIYVDNQVKEWEKFYNYVLDTNIIKNIINTPSSKVVKEVLTEGVEYNYELISEIPKFYIDTTQIRFHCYYEDSKYLIKYQERASEYSRKIDTVAIELSDFYCMVPIDYETCIVYDTYKSFYCIRFEHDSIKLSKRRKIEVKTKWPDDELNKYEWKYFDYCHFPLTKDLGGGLLSIFYGTETVQGTYPSNRPRETRPIHLLYQIEKDELIQDLDALINPKK